MRKVALTLICFITLLNACTPRPEEGSEGPVPGHESPQPDSRQSEADREYYILPADSVTIEQTAQMATIKMQGPLGDGCQKFAYVDSVRNGNTLELTPWASRPKAKNVPCTMIMQYYNTSVTVKPGEYAEVVVHAQDGKVIRERLQTELR